MGRIIYWVVTQQGTKVFAGIKNMGTIRNVSFSKIDYSKVDNVKLLADGSLYELEPIPSIEKSFLREKVNKGNQFGYSLARARVILAPIEEMELKEEEQIISINLKCNSVVNQKCSVSLKLLPYRISDESDFGLKYSAVISISKPSIFGGDLSIFRGKVTTDGILEFDKKQRSASKIVKALKDSPVIVQSLESEILDKYPKEYAGDVCRIESTGGAVCDPNGEGELIQMSIFSN